MPLQSLWQICDIYIYKIFIWYNNWHIIWHHGLAQTVITRIEIHKHLSDMFKYNLKFIIAITASSNIIFLDIHLLNKHIWWFTKVSDMWNVFCWESGALNRSHIRVCAVTKPVTDMWYIHILLKRSLESVALISLCNRLQTLADSERIDRSSYNFHRRFPTWPSPISVKSNSFRMTRL